MPKDLRGFVTLLDEKYPQEIVRVTEPVAPHRFDVTAVVQHLEDRRLFPALLFERPLSVRGDPTDALLVSNLFAARERLALALDLTPDGCRLPLSLEYARREEGRVAPIVVPRDEAPVQEVVRRGDAADLTAFPIVRHHAMDPAPYIDMTPVMRSRRGGFYNLAFLRTMLQGPRRLGIHVSPRHSWTIMRENEEENRETPVAIVIGHHPAFYLGALNVAPYGVDDYHLIGAVLNEPVRLTPSESFGDELLVPADAEMIVEGVIPPGVREVEGPFGEFTGYYGPQRLRPVMEVTAITHRHAPILQHVVVGHRDTWILGGLPKEGSLVNQIRGVVPTVTGVHFPVSGCCRFHCYISVDKKVEGETKQAALMAMAACDFVKTVVVVDADIDIFREEEVLWAVATRVQADEDVDIVRHVKGNTLDPSLTHDILTSKMIVDATRPLGYPFAERVAVPREALERVRLERYVPEEVLRRLTPIP